MKTREFLVLLAMHCCLTVHGIKIAAYNVRVFGQSKLGNTVAMNMITQVRLYDSLISRPSCVFVSMLLLAECIMMM